LTTFYNPDPSIHAETSEDASFAMITLLNEQHYALASLGTPLYYPAPSTYRDAMSRKDKPKWWQSMCLNLRICMINVLGVLLS
jgi:hypothetical protein